MTPDWRIKKGERVYAIGDIHGRNDLFADLIKLIREDNAGRAKARTRIILLGDVVDRGPDSRGLIMRLMKYTHDSTRFIVLRGNHEQIMLAALAGDAGAAKSWLKHGGATTLLSWGLPEKLIVEEPLHVVMMEARKRIPRKVIVWMSHLSLYFRSGNVLFVHAGVRPGIPLVRQDPLDLLWIREEFTAVATLHPFLVVHGHTIFEGGLDIHPNRIGIDTGAYRTGCLSALALEGDRTWSISTVGVTDGYTTPCFSPTL
ncbi:MAG: metallophosphoesterase family protein [Caulobacteraceae bacterium]